VLHCESSVSHCCCFALWGFHGKLTETSRQARDRPRRTVTLVYSIDGSTPVWGVSDTTGLPPATTAKYLVRTKAMKQCQTGALERADEQPRKIADAAGFSIRSLLATLQNKLRRTQARRT
jgi:hypothetical protein